MGPRGAASLTELQWNSSPKWYYLTRRYLRKCSLNSWRFLNVLGKNDLHSIFKLLLASFYWRPCWPAIAVFWMPRHPQAILWCYMTLITAEIQNAQDVHTLSGPWKAGRLPLGWRKICGGEGFILLLLKNWTTRYQRKYEVVLSRITVQKGVCGIPETVVFQQCGQDSKMKHCLNLSMEYAGSTKILSATCKMTAFIS